MNEYVERPFFDVLQILTNEKPPDFTKSILLSSELIDENFVRLQDWCASHSILAWSTGIGLIEAADSIVGEALLNCNIIGGNNYE